MSKQNNNNPNFYKDGTRNHQGEGIPQEHNREEMSENRKAQQNKGEKNFIPGEAPVGEKSKK
jgi:hypothetical protein